MKSVTDLEQSKKLIEILPEESADFYWICGRLHTDGPKYQVLRMKEEVIEPEKYWPAWSLSALLGMLPVGFLGKKGMRLNLDKSENDFSIWYTSLDDGLVIEHLDVESKEPVDACVAMIEKLSKEGLL